jgi:hypothetical protein
LPDHAKAQGCGTVGHLDIRWAMEYDSSALLLVAAVEPELEIRFWKEGDVDHEAPECSKRGI